MVLYLSRSSVVTNVFEGGVGEGLVDHVRQSVWEGSYQAEHSFILLKEERGIYSPPLPSQLSSEVTPPS